MADSALMSKMGHRIIADGQNRPARGITGLFQQPVAGSIALQLIGFAVFRVPVLKTVSPVSSRPSAAPCRVVPVSRASAAP